MPKLKLSANGRGSERNIVRLPGVDSEAIYLGAVVKRTEFGVAAFTDDATAFGVVVGFSRQGSSLPIWDDALKGGTVTDATGQLPAKYTFASTNDESNTTSAKCELVHVLPILPDDVWEFSVWGASTVAVDRGTTTAAGTTASSANSGVHMSVDTTYPWALTESTAAAAATNLDFITTDIGGKKPTLSHRVYVQCVRSFASDRAAN
jgi:hypothetical protein